MKFLKTLSRKLEDLRTVERYLMIFGLLSIGLFVIGYFIRFFFILFLASMVVLYTLFLVFWKCPYCGKLLWFNFEGICRNCGSEIYENDNEKKI